MDPLAFLWRRAQEIDGHMGAVNSTAATESTMTETASQEQSPKTGGLGLGPQDMATFGIVNAFAIAFFICIIRFVHRRRKRTFAFHDGLLVAALAFDFMSTISATILTQLCVGKNGATPEALKVRSLSSKQIIN
jgi:hypothetical protein